MWDTGDNNLGACRDRKEGLQAGKAIPACPTRTPSLQPPLFLPAPKFIPSTTKFLPSFPAGSNSTSTHHDPSSLPACPQAHPQPSQPHLPSLPAFKPIPIHPTAPNSPPLLQPPLPSIRPPLPQNPPPHSPSMPQTLLPRLHRAPFLPPPPNPAPVPSQPRPPSLTTSHSGSAWPPPAARTLGNRTPQHYPRNARRGRGWCLAG